MVGEGASFEAAQDDHARDGALVDHGHHERALGLERHARDRLEVGIFGHVEDAPPGAAESRHTEDSAGPCAAGRQDLVGGGIADHHGHELLALVVGQVDDTRIPGDQPGQVVGDRLKRRLVVRLGADVAQRLENRVELLHQLRGALLGATGLLEHLQAVDRCGSLLGDHLGQHVHALHRALVLLVRDDRHVLERAQVLVRVDADLAAVST